MQFGMSSSSRNVGKKSCNSFAIKNNLIALVVDDDVVTRKIHRKLLSQLGVEIKEAENGKEAVDLCFSGYVFDIILMDMDMPEMDGPDATRFLRSKGIRSKIVGVSSNTEETDRRAFVEAGLDSFQVKPLKRATLIDILQEFSNY